MGGSQPATVLKTVQTTAKSMTCFAGWSIIATRNWEKDMPTLTISPHNVEVLRYLVDFRVRTTKEELPSKERDARLLAWRELQHELLRATAQS